MNTTLAKKWAPALLSAAVVLFGGLQVLVTTGHGVVELLQFATLVVTTVTTTVLPLVDSRWQGVWKTGAEIVGVVITAVLPFAIDHTLTWANALLIAVAVVKALAAEFGVALRTSNLIDARSDTPDTVQSITTLEPIAASAAPAATDATSDDGLVNGTTAATAAVPIGTDEVEQSGTVPDTGPTESTDDGPKHLATS